MIKITTQNDVLRHIYKETNEQESRQIEQATLTDESLLEEYTYLLKTVEILDELKLKPYVGIIDSIKNYSKNYKVKSQKVNNT